MKKKILLICMFFVFIISTTAIISATNTIENPMVITFEDRNLYEKIKNHFDNKNNKIKYNTNEETLTIEVSQEDINNIKALNLQGTDGEKISDITGLEVFVNIEELNLASNNIREIHPISQLQYVKSINLSNNTNIKIYDKTKGECYLPNKGGIEELDIEGTNNSDIGFVSQLSNLKTLNAAHNGIGSITALRNLWRLETLNLSDNTAIKTIDDIIHFNYLKDLNMKSTGLTDISQIILLSSLVNLNIEDNPISSIDPVYSTYKEIKYDEETGKKIGEEEKACLENLQQLNFNFTGQSKINFSKLIFLENLTHLSMRGNNISTLNNNITELKNLQYINLSDNLLTKIDAFKKEIYDNDKKVYIPQYLTASTIELAHNKITDIELFADFDHQIDYLNLAQNAIYDVDILESSKFKSVNLREQGCGWEKPTYEMLIHDKVASVDQYIILPSLFQNSRQPGSKLYAQNASFEPSNIQLNNDPDYQVAGRYNVIIGYEKTKNDELKITLHGGIADGSTLYFKISTDSKSIDSSLFNDPNLIAAITKEIEKTYQAKKALRIINVESYVFDAISTLHLDGFEIKDIMGLSSFENLKYLYLSNNNITSIKELRENTVLKELYLANNLNLKDVTPIENMVNLTKLDLSNIGLTNINSVNNLIKNMYKKNKNAYPLKYLGLSSNNINGIDGIEVLVSLEELYIANIDIKDISKLSTLINLKTLNASGNKIEDLEILKNMTKLKYLYLNNNNISNIKPISKIALSTLEFSGNRVKDITSLTQSYSKLIMDSNFISDISCLDYMSFDEFSAKNQKIAYSIEKGKTGDVTIEIPALLQASQQSGSKVYSNKDFILTSHCNLTEDKKAVIVNVENLKNQIATVKIDGGNAHNTVFSIAEPLEGTITYEPSNEIPINKDVTASITFNRKNVTITNNDGKDTYLFTENGEFTFEYMDQNGFEGKTTAIVTNIDKTPPEGTVTQEIVDKQVVVKIQSNEPIAMLDGWTASEDGLILTKTYSLDVNETIILTDNAGNTSSVQVIVKIDKIPPVITGVENGKLYLGAVTPTIEDENIDIVRLLKDGVDVSDYVAGTPITKTGKYVLTAIDKFENEITINFDIDVTGMLLSSSNEIKVIESETIGEEQKPVIKISAPKTTISKLKESLQTEATFDIIDAKGEIVTNQINIGTGNQIKMESGKIYTVIVYGDITGDGEISISELAVASRIATNPEVSIEPLKFAAMDVSKDGKIMVPDLAVLSRLRNK